jgi:hypothetical protein
MPQHTKESIRALLTTNDKAVERAMVVLFDRQTHDEKATEETRHHNNRGFNHGDAKKGTYMARWVLSGRQLTGKHLDRARRMAIRYAGQLAEEANAKSESRG